MMVESRVSLKVSGKLPDVKSVLDKVEWERPKERWETSMTRGSV